MLLHGIAVLPIAVLELHPARVLSAVASLDKITIARPATSTVGDSLANNSMAYHDESETVEPMLGLLRQNMPVQP